MGWLIEPFQSEFMRYGLAAAVVIGLTCGMLGVYVVHRRMAFIGDAMAHTTLPGLAVAYLYFYFKRTPFVTRGTDLFLGALVAGLVTALAIGWISRRQKIKEDTAIGIAFTGMFALGILLMSFTKSHKDMTEVLVGELLGVSPYDLLPLLAVAGIVLFFLFLFHKELELTSFDASHAEVIGIRTGSLRYLLLILLALVVISGVQYVGVILILALLITPAATASLLTDCFAHSMWIAVAISTACSVLGAYGAYFLDFPPGASIVLACTVVFGIIWTGKSLLHSLQFSAEDRNSVDARPTSSGRA